MTYRSDIKTLWQCVELQAREFFRFTVIPTAISELLTSIDKFLVDKRILEVSESFVQTEIVQTVDDCSQVVGPHVFGMTETVTDNLYRQRLYRSLTQISWLTTTWFVLSVSLSKAHIDQLINVKLRTFLILLLIFISLHYFFLY